MIVKRHKVDLKTIKEWYDTRRKRVENVIGGIEQDASLLHNLVGYAHDCFFYSTVLEKDEAKIKSNLSDYVEASTALFKMFGNRGSKVSFDLRGKKYEVTAPEKGYTVSENSWIKTYYGAVVLRNDAIIKELEKVDLDEVVAQKKSKSSDYLLLFAKFLQSINDKDVNHAAELVKVSDASMEVKEGDPLYDYMLDVAGPQIDVFSTILYEEQEEFTEELGTALESFKDYHGKQTDIDSAGLISLPLTAICIFAKRQGLTIEHESDYIPSYLL
jgi:hypothetical protein